MQLPKQEIRQNTRQVSIREDIYQHMRNFAERQPLPPKLVDLVSLAVERYLDAEELKTKEAE